MAYRQGDTPAAAAREPLITEKSVCVEDGRAAVDFRRAILVQIGKAKDSLILEPRWNQIA